MEARGFSADNLDSFIYHYATERVCTKTLLVRTHTHIHITDDVGEKTGRRATDVVHVRTYPRDRVHTSGGRAVPSGFPSRLTNLFLSFRSAIETDENCRSYIYVYTYICIYILSSADVTAPVCGARVRVASSRTGHGRAKVDSIRGGRFWYLAALSTHAHRSRIIRTPRLYPRKLPPRHTSSFLASSGSEKENRTLRPAHRVTHVLFCIATHTHIYTMCRDNADALWTPSVIHFLYTAGGFTIFEIIGRSPRDSSIIIVRTSPCIVTVLFRTSPTNAVVTKRKLFPEIIYAPIPKILLLLLIITILRVTRSIRFSNTVPFSFFLVRTIIVIDNSIVHYKSCTNYKNFK